MVAPTERNKAGSAATTATTTAPMESHALSAPRVNDCRGRSRWPATNVVLVTVSASRSSCRSDGGKRSRIRRRTGNNPTAASTHSAGSAGTRNRVVP